MRNALLAAAGLTALRSVAAYDATVCGRENKFTSDDKSFISRPVLYLPVLQPANRPPQVDQSVPAFDASWSWEENPENVHSFPHVRFNSTKLPTRVDAIKTLRLATKWTMSKGTPSSADSAPRDFSASTWEESKADLSGVVANAAWDFFVDKNKSRTYNPVDAEAEIMIWLGKVGNPYPLMGDSILTNMTVGGTEFSLWYDTNQRDQKVFTWVTRDGSDVNEFDADVAPLFKYVLESGEIDKESWLGLVEFGSETWHSPDNITFSAANFAMELDNGDDGSGSGSGSGDDEEDAAGIVGVSALAVIAPAALMLASFAGLF
ncbi:glycosyl transferase [Colletotrichum plurivorum]|uniref:Glycosyl transferase n=1 Tax=Colletotrichum plurivorum TaxID=2175906 RepID=A0A8H6KD34_9PEZI|nr:glycosyl transferase [Colletotrichum plurivorum]